MSQTTHDLVDAIISGDSVAIEDAFNATMADKISARLEGMRLDVARSMFQTEGSCGYKKKMKESECEDDEEDKKEKMSEEVLDEMINEVLGKNEPAGAWISDFVHSDNPKFAGKSKEKRKQMALAAYYAKQKNEEIDVAEMLDYLSENEEVLSELSKATLQSYRSKIGHDLDRAMDAMPHGTGDDKEDRKLNNRMQGDERAAKRLMKK